MDRLARASASNPPQRVRGLRPVPWNDRANFVGLNPRRSKMFIARSAKNSPKGRAPGIVDSLQGAPARFLNASSIIC